MTRTQKCMRCRTYFTGGWCQRCEYQRVRSRKPWMLRWSSEGGDYQRKPGDSTIRIIQPPYRPTDPCE